jgi:hypothetical protein
MATTADDVWRLLGELVEAQKETERRFQETERLLKEQSRETERLLKEQSQRVDKQLGKLGNRLGEFVEWQIRPAAVRFFKERGLDVHELHSGVSAQRPEGGIEIDLLVVNSTEAVLIEVKSKLTQNDVDEHIERLEKFKRLIPTYRNHKALGAVAGMVVPKDIAIYAYRQGLFVIAQSGENVVILNDAQFQPKAW